MPLGSQWSSEIYLPISGGLCTSFPSSYFNPFPYSQNPTPAPSWCLVTSLSILLRSVSCPLRMPSASCLCASKCFCIRTSHFILLPCVEERHIPPFFKGSSSTSIPSFLWLFADLIHQPLLLISILNLYLSLVPSPQSTNIPIYPTPRKKMLPSILLLLSITSLASPQMI